MGKKKILIIDIGKEYGGAEIMIENLISAINDEVDISLVVNDNGIFKKNVLSKYNINVLCIRNSLKKLLSNIIKIKKYVKENNIDIINVHGIIAGLIGVSVKRTGKVKLIATIHSDLKYDFNGIKKLIYYWIEKIVVNNCDEVITVSEEEIAQGMLFLMEHQKVVAEGAGAVTTAALLSGKYKPQKDENVVCVISGGNVDVNTLYRVIGVGLAAEGRRYSFSATMTDKPGGFLELISISNANILNANQTRLSSGGTIGKQVAEFIIETFNHEHIEKLKAEMNAAGFEIQDL